MGEAPSQSGDRQKPEQEREILKSQTQAVKNQLIVIRAKMSALEKGGKTLSSHAVVDEQVCAACGICEEVCPVGAITVGETATVDPGQCTGCGECVDACPEGAISFQNDRV
jgi:ferredoxin